MSETTTGTTSAVSVTAAAETKPVFEKAPPVAIHTRMINTDADMLRDIANKHQAGKAELTLGNRRIEADGGYTVTITATVKA